MPRIGAARFQGPQRGNRVAPHLGKTASGVPRAPQPIRILQFTCFPGLLDTRKMARQALLGDRRIVLEVGKQISVIF